MKLMHLVYSTFAPWLLHGPRDATGWGARRVKDERRKGRSRGGGATKDRSSLARWAARYHEDAVERAGVFFSQASEGVLGG